MKPLILLCFILFCAGFSSCFPNDFANIAPPAGPPVAVPPAEGPPAEESPPVRQIACLADSDCALAAKGCCPCSSGGESIAIHKSQKTEYEQKLRQACGPPRFCPQVYRCAEFQALCENSSCVVRSPP